MTDPGPPARSADDPWGDPIGPLTLEWATQVDSPPPLRRTGSAQEIPRASAVANGTDGSRADELGADAAAPARSRRIRYAVGPARRTRSVVELLFVAAILTAVLAALLGAGVAGLVGIVHRAVRSN